MIAVIITILTKSTTRMLCLGEYIILSIFFFYIMAGRRTHSREKVNKKVDKAGNCCSSLNSKQIIKMDLDKRSPSFTRQLFLPPQGTGFLPFYLAFVSSLLPERSAARICSHGLALSSVSFSLTQRFPLLAPPSTNT